MATDGVKIIDGDLAYDTYEHIMELYDSCLLYTSPSPRDTR